MNGLTEEAKDCLLYDPNLPFDSFEQKLLRKYSDDTDDKLSDFEQKLLEEEQNENEKSGG